MVSIGTQSFSRLVGVRKNKAGEAVDLRRSLADANLGEQVLANFRLIKPQTEALRLFANRALSGGSVALAGAGGTGKSSLMYALARTLTVAYPSVEFTRLSDMFNDVHLVRSLAGLRTSGRRWLLVIPDFSSGDFVYAMRGALNGALLISERTADFVPKDGTLVSEYHDTAEFLRHQGNYDGILILGDNLEGILSECAANIEGSNSLNLRQFTAFCASNSFPVLFVAAVERDLSLLSAEEEEFLTNTFQRVHALTLLGKDGEWEDLVTSSILEHPDSEVWNDAVSYKDFHAIVEGTVHQGLYAGNSDKWLNDTVVCGCYPLHPAALFALPRVAMNLSSSTKTAFRFFSDDGPGGLAYFLNNYAVLQPNGRLHLYTVDWLCTYFEKTISKDPHHNFYTAALQNAILAAGDVPQSRRILRLIMIMQFIGNDHLRPQLETIIWALHLGEREERIVRNSLNLLLQKKALEYSEATKEYLLPVPKHEINVTQVVQRNRNRMRSTLDLRQELQNGLPALRIKSQSYNEMYCTDRCGIVRAYLSADIQDASQFLEQVDELVGSVYHYRGDMLFALVIPESESDMEDIIDRISAGKYTHRRLVMIVPKEAHRFAKDILEVRTLERMLNLEPPFSDATTAAHAKVSKMLDKVTADLDEYAETLLDYENLSYFYEGQKLDMNSDEQVEGWLDSHMPSLAGTPPIIASRELMSLGHNGAMKRNRHRLVKYLLATRDTIALRADAKDIKRIVDEGLLNTGVLCETMHQGPWTHYALNKDMPRTGVGLAFRTISEQILATSEKSSTVPVTALLKTWLTAPYAMTPALMEIILAIIVWHWPHEIRLYKNNLRAQAEDRPELLQPVKPSAEAVISMVASAPDWVIGFCESDAHQRRYLEGICRFAGASLEHEGSLWTHAAKSLIAWYKALPVANREPSLIRTQELQKFNRFLMTAPKQENLLREFVERKLPNMLGITGKFSWEESVDEILERLESLGSKLSGQIKARRERLENELANVFATSGQIEPWGKSAEIWIDSLDEDISIDLWQQEYDALDIALELPEADQLEGLIEALGYPNMESWKSDYVVDIAERMGAMCYALKWEYYCRGYRYADSEEAATQIGLDFICGSELSDEESQELLEAYLSAVSWPEAMDKDFVEIAKEVASTSLNTNTGEDLGDWLYDDKVNVFAGITVVASVDDEKAVAAEIGKLRIGDFLFADEEESGAVPIVLGRAQEKPSEPEPVQSCAPPEAPVSAESGFSIDDVDLSQEGGSFAALSFMAGIAEDEEESSEAVQEEPSSVAEEPDEEEEVGLSFASLISEDDEPQASSEESYQGADESSEEDVAYDVEPQEVLSEPDTVQEDSSDSEADSEPEEEVASDDDMDDLTLQWL